MRTEKEHRQTEADLRKSQRACEQLDSQKVSKKDIWWFLFFLYMRLCF